MADIFYKNFVAALSADTVGGSEKIAVVDGTTTKYQTPDLIKAYIIAALTASGAVTPAGGDALIMERSGTAGTFDLNALCDYVYAYLWTAPSEVTPATSADKLILNRAGTKYSIDIDTLVTYFNTSNGTLGAQIAALSAATLADSDQYALSQGGTAKKVTFANLSARVQAQFNSYLAALSAVSSPADADTMYVLQGTTAKKMTLTVLANTYLAAELDVEDFGWGMAEADPTASGDMLLMERSGTRYKLDVDTLVTFAASGLQDGVLTFSSLAAASPNAADMFTVDDSGTPKKLTLANLETKLWVDYAAYVNSLSAVSTTTATDRIYVLQGGTPKYVTPAVLSAFFNVTAGDVIAPVSTTQYNIPQWDSVAKKLTDGLSLVTTVRFTGSESDTALATEQAVSEAVEDITNLDIDGATDIGAALVDADLFIVDDGAAGANRKATMARLKTYIGSGDVAGLDIDGTADIGAALSSVDLLIVDDGAGGTNRKAAVSRVKTYLETVGHYDNIYIDAGSMHVCTTAGSAALATNEYGTNDIDLRYFAFDDGATKERVQFKMIMPEDWDRGTIKAKFYWSSATGSSVADTVEWGIKARAIDDNDAIDAALGTPQVISDTILAASGADMQRTAATPALTVGNAAGLGDMVVFEVYRNTDGADAMAEDAWLFGVNLQYQRNQIVAAW